MKAIPISRLSSWCKSKMKLVIWDRDAIAPQKLIGYLLDQFPRRWLGLSRQNVFNSQSTGSDLFSKTSPVSSSSKDGDEVSGLIGRFDSRIRR